MLSESRHDSDSLCSQHLAAKQARSPLRWTGFLSARGMAEPFVLRRERVVVEGGGLKEPWVADTKIVDGREFVALDKSDRRLARAMMRDSKSRTPWHNNDLLAFISKLRDEKVDELIANEKHANDPMADEDVKVVRKEVKSRGRGKSVKEGQIIDITYPAFSRPNGEMHDPQELSVLTASRRGTVAYMELTVANLDLLLVAAEACDHESPMGSPQQGGEPDDQLHQRVDLEQPACKWRRAGLRSIIYCRYRTADGEWKTHSVAPGLCDEPEAQQALVREAERRVQQFYDTHHVSVDSSPK